MTAEEFDLTVVDKLLTTTRAVRKRLDLNRPVPLDVILDCLRLAIQAPTGNNLETWRWVVVTDAEVRRRLGDLYRGSTPDESSDVAQPSVPPVAAKQQRLMASAEHLLRNIERVPVLVIPCVEEIGGAAGWAPSIYPAVWSFMLALRSRGLGSVITTGHLYQRAEADELLGVPDGFVQSCLVPVACYTGTSFKPAVRRPVEEVTYLDHWDNPLP
jgi:nitroreductase